MQTPIDMRVQKIFRGQECGLTLKRNSFSWLIVFDVDINSVGNAVENNSFFRPFLSF